MTKISIRSTPVLCILGGISIGLFMLVENTKGEQPQPFFEEKIAASRHMQNCVDYLKDKHFKDEITIDNINDPNETKLIGTQFSEITSGRGSLPVKLSTINPNFAALAVELFKKADIGEGDHVAICATGSFPALNIAVLSAAHVLGAEVSLISSVTSSSWGANDPDYTFLDIHSSLKEGGFIDHDIVAASIGANQDIGRTLSPEGREVVMAAIERNNILFINDGTLDGNIERRMSLFAQREKKLGKEIKLFVNIGGGIASLGSKQNSDQLNAGLTTESKLQDFPDKIGVVFNMAAKQKPYINLLHLQGLMKKYELPIDPMPLPEPGEGALFYAVKYNLRYVIGAFAGLVLLLFGVILYDKRQNALGKDVIHNPNN